MFNKFKSLYEKNKLIIKLLIALGLAVLILVVVFFACSQGSSPVETEITSQVDPVEDEPVDELIPEVVEPDTEEEDINFEELLSTNPDTIGYIIVPNTVIDYPVLRGVDNAKYLTTDFEGEYDACGSIFSDMFNSDSLTDPVTVLYGHYTPDETHFTQLHKYMDAEYFEQNPDMFLHTPQATYKYEVVAAFINDNLNVLYDKDYTDKEQLQGFIDHMANTPDQTANLNLEVVSTDDKFLVLSTCLDVANSEDNRYLVVGKLVETE